jgi:hypothetical protein
MNLMNKYNTVFEMGAMRFLIFFVGNSMIVNWVSLLSKRGTKMVLISAFKFVFSLIFILLLVHKS